MTQVQDKTECELAATSLGLQDTTAFETQIGGIPYGCIYSSNDWLGLYSPDGSPSLDCGTIHIRNNTLYTYVCICRLHGMHNF